MRCRIPKRFHVNRLATILFLASLPHAAGHPEHASNAVNRFLKVTLLTPMQFRLAYTITFGAEPAAAARKLADSNRDGHLDDREVTALADKVRKEVNLNLILHMEGARIRAEFETVDVGMRERSVSPEPFSIDLIGFIPVRGTGPHTVRVEDTTVLPPLGETEIWIEEGPPIRLLKVHRSGSRDEGKTHYFFVGTKRMVPEDRSVTFTFAERNPHQSRTWLWGLLVLPVCFGFPVLLYRYRSMKG
jgi:hypothetical protein